MAGIQSVNDTLGGQVHAKHARNIAGVVGEWRSIGDNLCSTADSVQVGVGPPRNGIHNSLAIEFTLGIIMMNARQLLGNHSVSTADGGLLVQLTLMMVIARYTGHKTAHQIRVGGDQTPENLIDSFRTVELSLNWPQIVVQHLLVRLEHTPHANRFECHLTLGSVV